VVIVPVLLLLVVAVFGGAIGFWFAGEWELARNCTIASILIGCLGYYHYWYYKRHPEERGSKSHRGPWDT
jgi:hypothetical protein